MHAVAAVSPCAESPASAAEQLRGLRALIEGTADIEGFGALFLAEDTAATEAAEAQTADASIEGCDDAAVDVVLTKLPVLTANLGALGVTDKSLDKSRRSNSAYVAFFRKQLLQSQQFALLRDECISVVQELWGCETKARHGVMLEEVVKREVALRCCVENVDAIERREYRRVRYEHSYLPWCNLGCKYCCKLQHELHRQVVSMADREVGIVVRAEAAEYERVVAAEEAAFERITLLAWAELLRRSVFDAGRKLLDRRECAARLLVTMREQKSHLKLIHAMNIGHESARFHDDSWVLKNQHLELCRLQDLLQLREEAVANNLLNVTEEKEECQRLKTCGDEENERALVLQQSSALRSALDATKNEERLLELRQQVDALSAYKADREAEELEERQRKVEEEQAALIAELDVIKGRQKKKKGAQQKIVYPQSVLQSEQCDRCKAKVTKQTYSRHIDKECPYRPVECRLCMLVMRSHELTEHIDSRCLSRSVPCDGCGSVYQARCIDAHLPLCQRITKAKALVPTLAPSLGVETEEAEGGLVVLSVRPGGPLEGHVSEEDKLVRLGGTELTSQADLAHALSLLTPGDTTELSVLPSSTADGPWWGGGNEEVAACVTVVATVQTTIPLGEYLEMLCLLEEDAKRGGEPQQAKEQSQVPPPSAS